MRTLVQALFLALVPFSAQADTITATWGPVDFSSSGPSGGTISARFEVREGQADVPYIFLRIPDFMPSETPQSWMITETTASDYGVDWALFEDALINTSGRYYSQQFGSTYNPGLVGLQWLTMWPDQTPVFTDVDAVEFKLDHFSNSPLGYSARWQWEASGRGRIVPEPGALVLVVIASLGWSIKTARSIRNPGDRG